MIFLLGCLNAAAQKNLVLNGDFEQYWGCPNNGDQINVANFWSAIDSLAVGNYSCVPDYCNRCDTSSDSVISVPKSRQYWQWPHSGDGMAQVLFFRNDIQIGTTRDYLQGRLKKNLAPGKSYCVAFYVSLSEASKWSIKEIGAYLDNGSIDTASECWRPQTRYTPQITNAGSIVSDTMRWTKIEGSFVASGSERFITIGNFNSNATTTKLFLSPNSYSPFFKDSSAAYLIDDVSVVETGSKADAGPDKIVGYGDSVYIGLSSSEVIWNSWSVLGSSTIIGEGPGIWVKPTATTQYVVTQTLCGTTTTDTVTVEVQTSGITSLNGKLQHYSISPNPASSMLQIQQSIPINGMQSFEIYNTMGQSVKRGALLFKESKAILNLEASLMPGVYYLSIKDNGGYTWNIRFVRL